MKKINTDKRFHGILGGSEYDLLLMSMPHYAQLQSAIGGAVTKHFGGSPLKAIQVLEIGPGSGLTTTVLLESDPRVKITAVDNEVKMVEKLSSKLRGLRQSHRVEIVTSDILTFLSSVPDNSFDAVASGFVLHNFENGFREKVVAEIYRVLRPHGLFVNGDKYAMDDIGARAHAYQTQIARFDVYDSIGRSDYKEGWIKHYIEDERPEVLFVEGLAKKHMRIVGFSRVTRVYRDTMEAVIIGVKKGR